MTRPEDEDARFWIGASTVPNLGSPAVGVRPLVITHDGEASIGEPALLGPNPMFLASDGSSRLAVAHQVPNGSVSVWSSDRDQVERGRQVFGSVSPCHLTFSADGTRILTADYLGGQVSVYSATGRVEYLGSIPFGGSGPDPRRQRSSHPHQVVALARTGEVLVPDLGADTIRVLKSVQGGFVHQPTEDIAIHSGAGPRHLAVSGDLAVVANELDRSLSLIDLVARRELYATSIGAVDVMDRLGPSGIRLTRHDTILVADRDLGGVQSLQLDRHRRRVEHLSCLRTGGRHPRDLELSADERFLVVAEQESDSLTVVSIQAGVADRVLSRVATPAPTCVLSVPQCGSATLMSLSRPPVADADLG